MKYRPPTTIFHAQTLTFPTLKTFTSLQPINTGPHTDADHPSSSKAS